MHTALGLGCPLLVQKTLRRARSSGRKDGARLEGSGLHPEHRVYKSEGGGRTQPCRGRRRGPPAGDTLLPALFPLISTISHAQLGQVTVEDGLHFRGMWGNRTPKTSPAVEVVV